MCRLRLELREIKSAMKGRDKWGKNNRVSPCHKRITATHNFETRTKIFLVSLHFPSFKSFVQKSCVLIYAHYCSTTGIPSLEMTL